VFFKWGDDTQMTCFSFLGGSDAANPCHLLQCCIENHYTNFKQQVTADMLPVLLSSFKVQDDVVTIKHTFFVTQT
jgi:hypothetical protein